MNGSLKRILRSTRCLLWEATVTEIKTESGITLCWNKEFQHADLPIPWLPIHRSAQSTFNHDFCCAVHPEDRQRIEETANRAIRSGQSQYQQKYRILLNKKDTIWIQEDVAIEKISGGTWKLVAVCTDLSTNSIAEEIQDKALSNAHCILWYANIRKKQIMTSAEEAVSKSQKTEASGFYFAWEIHLLNEAAANQWLPIPGTQDSVYSDRLYQATLTEDRTAGDVLSSTALLKGKDSYSQIRRVQTAGGEIRWIREDVSLIALGVDAWYAAGVMVDVTDQKKGEDSLKYQATHDSLTGSYNRTYLMEELTVQLNRGNTNSCLLFVDLAGLVEQQQVAAGAGQDVDIAFQCIRCLDLHEAAVRSAVQVMSQLVGGGDAKGADDDEQQNQQRIAEAESMADAQIRQNFHESP